MKSNLLRCTYKLISDHLTTVLLNSKQQSIILKNKNNLPTFSTENHLTNNFMNILQCFIEIDKNFDCKHLCAMHVLVKKKFMALVLLTHVQIMLFRQNNTRFQ